MSTTAPYYLQYDASTKWGFYNGTASLVKQVSFSNGAGCSSTTINPDALYPGVACAQTAAPTRPTILLGTSPSVNTATSVQGSSPNLALASKTTVIVQNRTQEVQKLQVTTTDGIIFGGYTLDFNASGVPVYFRADESAQDFKYKFESLPTVGTVNVSRSEVVVNGNLVGYSWSITFLSDAGDLPLITYSLTPSQQIPLSGNGLSFIPPSEVVKGVSLPVFTTVSNLSPGQLYSVVVYSSTQTGKSISAAGTELQNRGGGVAPFGFLLGGKPNPPTITSISPLSSSQLQVNFLASSSNGADVEKYLVEYTSNINSTSSFLSYEQYVIRIYNKNGNDTRGFWRLTFQSLATPLLSWGATASDLKGAINALLPLQDVNITRKSITKYQGFEYYIQLRDNVGPETWGNFSIDTGLLTSESLTHSFVYSLKPVNISRSPLNYNSQWIYKDCGKIGLGSSTSHQVVSIHTLQADVYGTVTGEFQLSVGSQTTPCLSNKISAFDLQAALMKLANVEGVYVEEHKRSILTQTNTEGYRDLHVYFESLGSENLYWPLMKIPQNGLFAPNCSVSSVYTTATVTALDDKIACFDGVSEIQTIVLESNSAYAGGFFYIYYMGVRSTKLYTTATADDVVSALTSLSLNNTSVSRYLYADEAFQGYAWVITFPASYGNVEKLVVDGQFISGHNANINVYPLLNISIAADNNDISGQFQIALDDQISTPLSWDATDSAIMSALHNLTNVGKVAMLGLRAHETSVPLVVDATSAVVGTNTFFYSKWQFDY